MRKYGYFCVHFCVKKDLLQLFNMFKIKYLYRAFRYRFRNDPFEIAYILLNLKKGQVCADIGAHKGAYLYWMQKVVGETGKVYAFEPQPILFEYLQKVKRKMDWQHVVIDNRAISSEKGSFDLYIPQHGSKTSPGATLRGEKMQADMPFVTVKVETLTLDDFFSDKKAVPDFLKIDVEGNELKVFEGAKGILQKKKPILLFECEQRHLGETPIETVFSFLAQYAYQGYFIQKKALHPISAFSVTQHQVQGAGKFWEAEGYCNNFVFF